MRFAENFNPEWGYLSPAPGFMRTVRIAVVAAAVGAIAGGGVAFSLLERPEPEEASIAARTLIEPAGDLPAPAASPSQIVPVTAAAEDRPQTPMQSRAPAVAAVGQVNRALVSSSMNSVAQRPANDSAVAGVSAEPAAAEEPAPGQSLGASEAALAQKSAIKPRHLAVQQARPAARGPLELLRSFAARATTWPPRAD